MIKIKNNKEPLLDINQLCSGLIIDIKPYKGSKKPKAYFRKAVAKMICKAKKYLPENTTFIIGDAWRPKEIQKEIYRNFIKKFSKKHPSWPKKRIIKQVEKFVAPYEGKCVSGHMTGGAVDLRLYKNGRKIPMKTSKLSYSENAKSIQPKLPKYIQKNRKIMFKALQKAGLSNYPKEYWHWSYGDYWWAKRNKKKIAVYGPVEKVK